MGFILCFLLSERSVRFAQDNDTLLQVAEPFVWIFGDARNILLVSMLLVLLFADMPFLHPGTPFYLARTSRAVWLFGQIVYISAATSLYLLFILVSSVLLCSHLSFAGDQWSETAAMLAHAPDGFKIALPSTLKTLEASAPYACALQIFTLMLLYTLFVVSLMLALSLWKGKAAGFTGIFAVSIYGLLLTPDSFCAILRLPEEETYRANVLTGWLSPLNQATYPMHNFGYDLLPRLWQSRLIFICAIAALYLWSLALMRRYSFHFSGIGGEKT